MNLLLFFICLFFTILFIKLAIAGTVLIHIVDIIFLGVELFFFSFIALRPYGAIIDGHSFMDPGDEQIFLPWYQNIIQKANNFSTVHGHTMQQSLLTALAIAGAVAVFLILMEFVFSRKVYALSFVRYPAGLFASWLFMDNMRTMGEASLLVRVITFLCLVVLHIVVFLLWDRANLKGYI